MRFLTCFLSLLFALSSLHAQEGELAVEKPILTLYYAPWCYYCHKVITYLKKINQQVPLKDVQNPQNKEELITIGGKKQVPCLIIDGEPLYESSDIIAWLSSHQELLEEIE